MNANDPDGEFLNVVIGFTVGFALDVAVQKLTNPDQKIDFRQATISGAAGAIGVGVAQKLHQGLKAVKATKAIQVAHQASAGANINVAAGVVNNLTDGDSETGATDGLVTNAVTGAVGAGAGILLGDALDAPVEAHFAMKLI